MTTVYLICAAVGGTILIIQFILSLIGLGGDETEISGDHVDIGVDHVDIGGHHFDVAHDFSGDHDVAGDHDFSGDHGDAGAHDSSWFFSVLSFRSIVAAIAFFGLGGLWATTSEIAAGLSILIAFAAGSVAMLIVAWLMSLLHHLGTEGTARIESTVGATATVYLTIPPAGEGTGKVTVEVQNRTMEYLAVTKGNQKLPSGSAVTIRAVINPETVEVEPYSG